LTWPAPEVGQIVRYAYLWRHEAERGQDEGLKDRPVVIVIARQRIADKWRVVVAPITHTRPSAPDKAVELPIRTARRMGLDNEPQWVSTTDMNAFVWPGPDLRPVSGKGPESVVIGRAPSSLMRVIIECLQRNLRSRAAAVTIRDV
jgi:hypothetical protein